MTDPHVYPVAQGIIPFDGPVLVTGGLARACLPEEANAVAVGPSYRGLETAWPDGKNIRARMLPGKDATDG